MADVYEKERFVKNLNGTSILEISAVVSIAPICCLLRFFICLVLALYSYKINQIGSFILDSFWLILPNLLVLTALADYVFTFNAVLLLLCAVVEYPIRNYFNAGSSGNKRTTNIRTFGKKQYISNFRSFMLVATVLSILAVDFKIFPRRYAKSEQYGTGFMDIGVGSFIFSHAIVSRFAKESRISKSKHLMKGLLKSALGCLPLCILGAIRLVMVKSSGYQEHVTEYGLHWNFFFTLAFVKLFAEALLHILPQLALEKIWLVGITVCSFHQMMLSQFGLKKLVEDGMYSDGTRNNLIDANREGLSSCLGYIGLFFLSCQLGKEIFKTRSKFALLRCLLSLDVFLWLSTVFCVNYVDSVSRKLANITYTFWILSLNVYLLICFLTVDVIQDYIKSKFEAKDARVDHVFGVSPRRHLHEFEKPAALLLPKQVLESLSVPDLVTAIDGNQLFYFVIGNLLTGIVNVSMQTTKTDDLTAFAVLTLYAIVVNGLATIVYLKSIKTKFW